MSSEISLWQLKQAAENKVVELQQLAAVHAAKS